MSARGSRSLAGACAALALLTALAGAGDAAAAPAPEIERPQDESSLGTRELGAQLFAGNCARCHGIGGRGIRRSAGDRGPSLVGVGRLAADFYLRTGYMPLVDPDDQPRRRRPAFSDREIEALTDYVDSLGGGPPVPAPQPASGSLAEGRELFTEHCAGCHQVVAQGGVVTGARVPPLGDATARQVAEAVRIGPYVMPRFSKGDISDAQLDSIVRYVEYAKHPDDRGGWGIGNIGPVSEGMVTWLIGALVLVASCMAIGQRLRA
jgi:ubiquinol-cytochrome c reductase cytochrome c subunit